MVSVRNQLDAVMMTKPLTLAILLLSLSGCIVVPEIKLVERFEFNYQPDQTPMSYKDLLCCYDCHA